MQSTIIIEKFIKLLTDVVADVVEYCDSCDRAVGDGTCSCSEGRGGFMESADRGS